MPSPSFMALRSSTMRVSHGFLHLLEPAVVREELEGGDDGHDVAGQDGRIRLAHHLGEHGDLEGNAVQVVICLLEVLVGDMHVDYIANGVEAGAVLLGDQFQAAHDLVVRDAEQGVVGGAGNDIFPLVAADILDELIGFGPSSQLKPQDQMTSGAAMMPLVYAARRILLRGQWRQPGVMTFSALANMGPALWNMPLSTMVRRMSGKEM